MKKFYIKSLIKDNEAGIAHLLTLAEAAFMAPEVGHELHTGKRCGYFYADAKEVKNSDLFPQLLKKYNCKKITARQ